MNKLFKIVQGWLAVFIALIGIFLLITLFPIKGNYQVKVVLSGSMEPSIRTGSIVVIKPAKQYAIGDIVVFGQDTRQDIPTTHRIVADRAVDGVLLFTTKGDANKLPDTTEIRLSDIHGRVALVLPYLGYLLELLRRPLGMIVVIIIPALLLIYSEVAKIINEVKKLKVKKAASSRSFGAE